MRPTCSTLLLVFVRPEIVTRFAFRPNLNGSVVAAGPMGEKKILG